MDEKRTKDGMEISREERFVCVVSRVWSHPDEICSKSDKAKATDNRRPGQNCLESDLHA